MWPALPNLRQNLAIWSLRNFTAFFICDAEPQFCVNAAHQNITFVGAVTLGACTGSRGWALREAPANQSRGMKARSLGLPHELSSSGSMDDDLARELSEFTDSMRHRVGASRRTLDLLWRIDDKGANKPQTCPCCSGSGWSECKYCHSTGFLNVGDFVIRDPSTGRACACPVCKVTLHPTGGAAARADTRIRTSPALSLTPRRARDSRSAATARERA